MAAPNTPERFEVQREIAAAPAAIFALLSDPRGHVAIDSSGMLQSADGAPVRQAGDTFVVHMDREALNDYPMGRYDVTVIITRFEPDTAIEWTISGTVQPPLRHLYGYRLEPRGEGTLVTSYYDWSEIDEKYRAAGIFPVIPEAALRATLGILARTVERHGPAEGPRDPGGRGVDHPVRQDEFVPERRQRVGGVQAPRGLAGGFHTDRRYPAGRQFSPPQSYRLTSVTMGVPNVAETQDYHTQFGLQPDDGARPPLSRPGPDNRVLTGSKTRRSSQRRESQCQPAPRAPAGPEPWKKARARSS